MTNVGTEINLEGCRVPEGVSHGGVGPVSVELLAFFVLYRNSISWQMRTETYSCRSSDIAGTCTSGNIRIRYHHTGNGFEEHTNETFFS